MEDAILGLQAQNIEVIFTGLHGQPEDILKDYSVIPELIDNRYCFESFKECITWLEGFLKGERFNADNE